MSSGKISVSARKSVAAFFYSVLCYLLFWLCFFQAARSIFLIYHFPLASKLDSATIFKIFLYGFYVDTSTSCYLIVVPYLFCFIQLFRPSRILGTAITLYSSFMVGLVAIISTAVLEIYRTWGVKLNTPTLRYLRYPQEAAASMASSPILLLVGIFLGLTILAVTASGCFDSVLKLWRRATPRQFRCRKFQRFCWEGPSFPSASGQFWRCSDEPELCLFFNSPVCQPRCSQHLVESDVRHQALSQKQPEQLCVL